MVKIITQVIDKLEHFWILFKSDYNFKFSVLFKETKMEGGQQLKNPLNCLIKDVKKCVKNILKNVNNFGINNTFLYCVIFKNNLDNLWVFLLPVNNLSTINLSIS